MSSLSSLIDGKRSLTLGFPSFFLQTGGSVFQTRVNVRANPHVEARGSEAGCLCVRL